MLGPSSELKATSRCFLPNILTAGGGGGIIQNKNI